MKIKMKSIHANIINETVSASATDVRAQIEIGYSHDEKNRLQLLNEAVENLQERIEIILALLTEEMGFELLS